MSYLLCRNARSSQSTVARSICGGRGSPGSHTGRELCMISHYPGSLGPRSHPSDAAGGGGEGQRSERAPVVSHTRTPVLSSNNPSCQDHVLLICRDHSNHNTSNLPTDYMHVLNACMLIRILKDSLIDSLTCIIPNKC